MHLFDQAVIFRELLEALVREAIDARVTDMEDMRRGGSDDQRAQRACDRVHGGT